jgi:hypothetical protein
VRITSQRQPRIRLRAAWSWLWLVVLSLPADAQTLDPAVEAMLREGIAHRVAGRDEAAVERFEAAYRALRAPITAGQLALACQAAGRWVDADRYMREALAAPNDGWVRRRRRELDEAYAVTQRNVGELELRGGPDGATVRVEGATVGTLPLTTPLRLRAGTVTVDVRADGYLPCTRQVTILGGELTREPLAMTAVPAPPAAVVAVPSPAAAVAPLASLVVPQPVAAPPARAGVPVMTWVLGGVGGALLAGGAVSIALRESAASRFNADCARLDAVPREMQSAACRDELATGDWTTATAIVGFAGGAALATAGVLIAALSGRRDDAPRAWRCAPALGGAVCQVTF